jgi:hypothetical protein
MLRDSTVFQNRQLRWLYCAKIMLRGYTKRIEPKRHDQMCLASNEVTPDSAKCLLTARRSLRSSPISRHSQGHSAWLKRARNGSRNSHSITSATPAGYHSQGSAGII